MVTSKCHRLEETLIRFLKNQISNIIEISFKYIKWHSEITYVITYILNVAHETQSWFIKQLPIYC